MSGGIKAIIKNGRYAGEEVNGEYTVLGPWKIGAKGGFVTVPGIELGYADRNTARVLVTEDNVTTVTGSPINSEFVSTSSEDEIYNSDDHSPETDANSLERIKDTFAILDDMAHAVSDGKVKGLIVFGPAGVGKSYNIKKVFENDALLNLFVEREVEYKFVSGYMRPIHLYKKLYECRKLNHTLILDDCDSVLTDPDSLNLLKSALDTMGERHIAWHSEARFLQQEDLPNEFLFEGSIIFITNTDFDYCRAPKVAEHLKAIISRCHYLDLTIDTKRDKFLWLKEVAINSNILTNRGLDKKSVTEIIDFIEENVDEMKDLSLRLLILISDHYKINPDEWKRYTRATCMKRSTHSKLARQLPDIV